MSINDNTTIDIPLDLELNTTVIDLDLRNLKNNPYHSESNSQVSSDILSFTIKKDNGGKIKINNTKTPFILKMQVKRINGILPVTSCNYWNEELKEWDSKGCIASKYEGDNLLCLCNHLTDFSSNRPKYNAVDPVGDFAMLKYISWTNLTSVAVLAELYLLYIVIILINQYKNHHNNERQRILNTFGVTINNHLKYQEWKREEYFFEKLGKNLSKYHHWIAILNGNSNDEFGNQFRITLVFCILMATLTSNALFYGQTNDSFISLVFVSLITSIIITMPIFIFVKIMNITNDYEERYRNERGKNNIFNIDFTGRLVNVKLNNSYTKNTRNTINTRNKFEFPFRKVTYIGTFIFIIFTSYLIVLFGIKFTGNQANNWLITSILSTMNDIIILQPITILIKTKLGFS